MSYNPTKEQTTAEGHQLVLNVVKNSYTQRRALAGPETKMYTSSVIMHDILNSEIYTRN